MNARRTAVVVTGVLTVGAVAAAITVFNLPEHADQPSSADAAPAATAEIAKETLVDRENHDGTLAHGDTVSILSRASGTVTALPAEGATIKRGSALFRADNKPVTLLYGALPAYRTLQSGVKGADVKQFEQNLWALGYHGFTVDSTYSASTATAVKLWQAHLGLTKTGTVDPAQIVYSANELRVASLSTQLGAVIGPGTEVEKVTGTQPLVTVPLDATSSRLATQNAAVQVQLPNGKVVNGKIIKIVTAVTKADDGQTDTTKFQVTIRFTSVVATQGSASVSVAFTAGQRPDVLTVPVAALLALAEGGYGVQVVDGSTTKIVPVDTGLFANGKVEIKGNGLQAGMKVGLPS